MTTQEKEEITVDECPRSDRCVFAAAIRCNFVCIVRMALGGKNRPVVDQLVRDRIERSSASSDARLFAFNRIQTLGCIRDLAQEKIR